MPATKLAGLCFWQIWANVKVASKRCKRWIDGWRDGWRGWKYLSFTSHNKEILSQLLMPLQSWCVFVKPFTNLGGRFGIEPSRPSRLKVDTKRDQRSHSDCWNMGVSFEWVDGWILLTMGIFQPAIYWRCISYWQWGYSSQLFYQRVHRFWWTSSCSNIAPTRKNMAHQQTDSAR